MLALIDAIESIEWNPLRWAIDTRMRLAVLMLRLYAGAALLWVGYQQWEDKSFAINLPSVLMGWAQQNPFFFYEDILKYIATPNAHILAWVLPILQMAIGALLVTGLFTRWASIALIFLALNFYLAMQHTGPAAAGLNIAFMTIGAILLFAEAGLAYGLDQAVFRLGIHFGWIKPPKRKKKRVRLAAPKPLAKQLPAKLKEVKLIEKQEKAERIERPKTASSNKSLDALGDTIKKLKERQKLKEASRIQQNKMKRYEREELDDDDDDDDDDIYAYHGDDDDDDDDDDD